MSHRKPPERRQGRGTADLTAVASVESLPAPAAGSWRPSVVSQWEDFWGSPLAQHVETSDEPALRRLYRLYDEIEGLWESVDETGRVVAGSQGQPRPNPLLKAIEGLQSEARQLEDRFGLSPKARLNLGITFAEAHRSLDDLNERLFARLKDQDDVFDAVEDVDGEESA